jgi:hypothetical protein
MSRLVFLVEERSMANFLEVWLAREHPNLPFLCLPHEGKSDLRRSIPRKLRAWREPGVRFVVIIDNDGGDCEALKAELVELCHQAGRDDALIRIACQELEAWYLGDPEALGVAFSDHALPPKLRKARFRNPDAIPRPSDELARLFPAFQKVSGARAVAAHIDIVRNKSVSFRIFAAGINDIAGFYPPPQSDPGGM